MSRLHPVLLCLAALTSAQADDPGPKLEGWTYRCSARPLADQYADPGDRLTDGVTDRGHTAIWQAASITIEADLGGSCTVAAAKVYQFRHNLNYKLDHLTVQVRRGGQWVDIKTIPGFYGPTPTNDFVHDLDLGGVATDALRLQFAGVGVLSLSEIELFGRRTTAAAATGAYPTVPFQTGRAPTAREEDLDGDGQPELILENRYVRLIFAPGQGGVCRSLRLKDHNAELVYAAETGYGLFRDQFWKPNYDFAERFYFHRLENAPDHATVELWATGAGGMMSFTEVRKTITLGADSSAVDVHYAVSNEPSSQTDYEYGFWSHNWLGVPGATNSYFFPTTEGVQSFTLQPGQAGRGADMWYRDPARGWTAVVSEGGSGLVLLVPWRYLNLFYSWYGTSSLAATHEWRLNLVTVPSGAKLEFDATLLPTSGMPAVNGVVDGIVGDLDANVGDGTINATVHALQPMGYGALHRVRWALQTWPERKPAAQADDQPLELGPGGVLNSKATWTEVKPGGYLVRLEVLRGDQVVGAIERPVAMGGVRLAYQVEPEGAQEGRREEATAKPSHTISSEVETPHIPWAKPYAGGRIKALVLLDELESREAVELAERVDLDLDYTKYRTNLDKEFLYQGDLSILTLEAAQQALLGKLKANSYDLFVISGFNWSHHFTPEIRQAILDQVSAGAGLLAIQPDGVDADTAREVPVLGVAKEGDAARNMNAWFRWQPVGDSPLAGGLDWSRFPVTRRHNYDTPPQGTVIATSGDDGAPLITLGELGKGRTVSCTWDVLTHTMGYRGYAGLTPSVNYRGGWLRPDFAQLPKGYQETWFALLARLVAWAAGRDTGVEVVSAFPYQGPRTANFLAEGAHAERIPEHGQGSLEIVLRAAKTVPGASVEVEYVHSRYGLVGSARLGFTRDGLGAGLTVCRFPANGLAGDNFAFYQVRDAAGASLAWGFTTVQIDTPTTLADLTVAPDTLLPKGGVWQDDGPVETDAFEADQPLQIAYKLGSPAPAGLKAEIELSDTAGRTLHSSSAPLAAGATDGSTTVTLPPLVDQGIQCRVVLRDAQNALLDCREARVVAYRPRVWNRFWYTSWGGCWDWRTQYLYDDLSKLVRDWGIDVSFNGTTELGTGRVRDDAYWGINHSWLGLLGYLGRGVPDFMDSDFARKAAEYAKTKDKQYLVRTPSLVDPDWREAVRKVLVERATLTMPAGGTYDYCMGDEMSLTSYTRFHDFDWSEPSLNDFRGWLRQRYPALDALDTSWGTSFKTWDEVMPKTREEAQEADNPAAWAEFRVYMNDQLAGFYRFVEDTLRSVDPHAHAGLSGTQSPEAGNGMDWWKLSSAFSYYHSYNTSWSNEMRRSWQALGGADQSPYFSGYSVVDPGAEHNLYWCLFHDTRGISCWKTDLFFFGDWSATQSGIDTKRHLDLFRRGLWRLIRGAKRQHDGVAIYYSMPSIIAGALHGQEAAINSARDSWVKLLEDLGLQYEFVAYQQVADGVLDGGDYKVVVMPYTIALSRAEADALHRFVANGGTLLATRPVGGYDELSRPQQPGLLDDLFQASAEGAAEPVEPKFALTEAVAELAAGTEVRLPPALSNLALHGATALGAAGDSKVPVVTRGSDGDAVLLNLDLSNFEQERRFHTPAEGQLKAIVRELLASAGVTAKYPLTLKSGQPSQVEMVRYDTGELEYLCLLNSGNDADVASIDLGGEKQVYDLRAEADRGRMSTLQVPLEPSCARVYCLAPAPLPQPTLQADAAVDRGQSLAAKVGRAAAAPEPQLIRLILTDPSGTERKELQQTVWVSGEPVSTAVPFALNDAKGDWTLTATGVVTGQAVTARVAVR